MKTKLTLRDFSLLLSLLAIGSFFTLAAPQFLSSRNLSMLAVELAITATLALGMLLVILPGHIDLSVGSGVGLMGGIASVLIFNHHWPAGAAIAVSMAAALLLWMAMGSLIVRQRIPAFIITLGGLLIFKGTFWLVIGSRTIPVVAGGQSNLYSLLTTFYFPPVASAVLVALVFAGLAGLSRRARRRRSALGFAVDDAEVAFLKLFLTAQGLLLFVLTVNQFRGIPLPVVILGCVALVIQVITRHTPFGRHLYAIGGNEEAAFVSGVPVQRTVIGAFTLLGGIVAVTGLMQTAYAGASTTTVGDSMELDAIAACVIGGTSLRGGRGTVLGVIFGALIMASLLNGMTLLAVAPELKFIVRGVVLTLAVWMDVKLAKR
ncbi:MAG: D-xylose transport system permease protein [Verrucomicrobia bacterium]|jgi:D-xylose transport system permease protein|nr:MAG: D-xylose transport system permease protein [Verrucomicrobiota bacterium]